jgi:hypothetical protein
LNTNPSSKLGAIQKALRLHSDAKGPVKKSGAYISFSQAEDGKYGALKEEIEALQIEMKLGADMMPRPRN